MTRQRSPKAELTNQIANRRYRLTCLRYETQPNPCRIYELEIEIAALEVELAVLEEHPSTTFVRDQGSEGLRQRWGGGMGRDVNAATPSKTAQLFRALYGSGHSEKFGSNRLHPFSDNGFGVSGGVVPDGL